MPPAKTNTIKTEARGINSAYWARKNTKKVTIKLCLEGEAVFQERKRCVMQSRHRKNTENSEELWKAEKGMAGDGAREVSARLLKLDLGVSGLFVLAGEG